MATQGKGPARTFLLLLLAASLVLVAAIIRPFASALFLAAVLAVTFHPWYSKLTRKLRGHRTTAAAIITLGLVLALVLPIGALGTIAAREAGDTFDYVHQVLAEEGVEGLIRQIPPPLQGWVDTIWRQSPSRDQDADFIYGLERKAAGSIPRIVSNIGQVVGQTLLMIVALFFLLMDGRRLVEWVDLVSPLQRRQMRELFTEFRRVSATVLLGSVVTAAAQATVAYIGYLIARAPNAVFLGLLTFLLGLVPIIGAGGFSFLVSIFLYLTGHHTWAIFLAIWSALVVGMVDNVLKPMIIKGGMEMHGAVVFFALMGGFVAFGLVGLVLGPLSVSLLLAVLRIYERDFAEPDVTAASPQ
jgi:predicted PurR-regulated permease PerM